MFLQINWGFHVMNGKPIRTQSGLNMNVPICAIQKHMEVPPITCMMNLLQTISE
jgi:hypothetical protein